MSASYDPGGYSVMLHALRNANVGMTLTVWKDGYRLWRPLDAEYSRKEEGWMMEIPLTEIVAEAVRIASGVKDGEQIPVERLDVPNPTRAALEECVRAMEQTEWVQEDDSGWEVYVCPSCGEYKLDGHVANCIKAKALKSARTALQEPEKE